MKLFEDPTESDDDIIVELPCGDDCTAVCRCRRVVLDPAPRLRSFRIRTVILHQQHPPKRFFVPITPF